MTTIGDISFGAHFLDKNDETPEILIEGKFLLLCNYRDFSLFLLPSVLLFI